MTSSEDLKSRAAAVAVVEKAAERFSKAQAAYAKDTKNRNLRRAFREAGEALSAARAKWREDEEAAGRRTPTAQPIQAGVKAMNGGK